MLLYRTGPQGFYAVADATGEARLLYSDPFETLPGSWQLGRSIDLDQASLLAPCDPGTILGVGRNYVDHARELGNPVPAEPVLFLKSPTSIVGPRTPIVLPPESDRVEFEGEIAVVLRQALRRAGADEARSAILGVTCAVDVTARDLQRRDPTFARAKSFDTFCPFGPAILVEPELDGLEVSTRLNGEERQRGHASEMSFGIVELLVYASAMMTLEAGDVVLTGTPAGVGPLADGDALEVEIGGVGVLRNPVEKYRGD